MSGILKSIDEKDMLSLLENMKPDPKFHSYDFVIKYDKVEHFDALYIDRAELFDIDEHNALNIFIHCVENGSIKLDQDTLNEISSFELIKYIYEKNPDLDYSRLLPKTVFAADEVWFERALKDAPQRYLNTALYEGVRGTNEEMVKRLVERGAVLDFTFRPTYQYFEKAMQTGMSTFKHINEFKLGNIPIGAVLLCGAKFDDIISMQFALKHGAELMYRSNGALLRSIRSSKTFAATRFLIELGAKATSKGIEEVLMERNNTSLLDLFIDKLYTPEKLLYLIYKSKKPDLLAHLFERSMVSSAELLEIAIEWKNVKLMNKATEISHSIDISRFATFQCFKSGDVDITINLFEKGLISKENMIAIGLMYDELPIMQKLKDMGEFLDITHALRALDTVDIFERLYSFVGEQEYEDHKRLGAYEWEEKNKYYKYRCSGQW